MVTQYGMSDKFGLMGLESIENKYLDGRPVLNCGDTTAGEIDKEVMSILKQCYERAETLLAENRDVLDKIAEYLIAKETITGEEFMKIYREVKGIDASIEENSKEELSKKDNSTEGEAKEELLEKENSNEGKVKEELLKKDNSTKEDAKEEISK